MPSADVVVVGGGLAGLAAAWLATRRGMRAVVLEAAPRVGGRARQIHYPAPGGRALVAGGAGIGRKRRDRRLRALLGAMRVPARTFRHRVYYGGGSRRAVRAFLAGASKRLREAALDWRREERRAVAAARRRPPGPNAAPRLRPRPTFARLLRDTLGAADARRWRELMGFGDDARADGIETAMHYNFKDNFGLGIGLRVPWNLLADRLAAAIRRGGGRVITRARVDKLLPGAAAAGTGRSSSGGAVVSAKGAGARSAAASTTWVARRRLVLALPASAAQRLLRPHLAPGFPAKAVLPRPQPFLLAYDVAADALSRARLARAVPRYRVLPGSDLQKILPVDPAGGVYMVAYADGERAARLARRIGAPALAEAPLVPPSRCAALRDEVRRALRRPDLRFVGEAGPGRRGASCLVRFIPEGTHYHPPLPRHRYATRAAALAALAAALPPQWRWVGEAVAEKDQGWVEGALESVERELGWGRIG
jgi:glycine/D-amino acid oxidase-like deaminating enzyme